MLGRRSSALVVAVAFAAGIAPTLVPILPAGARELDATVEAAMVPAGEWLAGDLHVHTCASHDTYCARGEKGSYFEKPTNGPLDAVLGPVGGLLPGETLDEAGLGDRNTDFKDSFTLGSSVTERFTEAAAKGLDYLAITDHSSSNNLEDDGSGSVHDPGFASSGVLGIPGYENSLGGHAQMLGATRLYDPGSHSAADVDDMADALRADGGVFQANHPDDSVRRRDSCEDTSNMNWSYGYDVRVDTVEVWNVGHFLQPPAPASQSNDDAIWYWECLLARGWHVAPTGGSDSHWKTTTAFQGIGNPTTWIFTEDRSTEGLLAGLRAGRTGITFTTPILGGEPILLEGDVDGDGVYEAMVGDTVPPGTPLRVRSAGAATGLIEIRANSATVLRDVPLAPGGTVDVVLDEPGYVWAALTAIDPRASTTEVCDPSFGDDTTYCRNQLNVQAMTAAIYVDHVVAPTELTFTELRRNGRWLTAGVTLTDDVGRPLSGKQVAVEIDGTTITAITGASGELTVRSRIGHPHDRVQVTARFAGDPDHAPSELSVSL